MDILLYKQYQEIEDHHWWFIGRRKIIYDLLQRYIGSTKSTSTIFDFGCNTGHLVGELQKKDFCVYGVDVSDSAIEYGRSQGVQNIEVYNPDNFKFEKDMFPDKKFDIILALDVIEHIENDVATLELLKQKLAPNGKIIVMVPAFMFLWGLQDEVAHHFRRYTSGTLRASVEKAKLRIVRMTYFNIFLFFPIALVRLLRRYIPSHRTSDFDLNHPIVNRVFAWIFCAEALVVRYVKFPFGVSLLAVIENHEA